MSLHSFDQLFQDADALAQPVPVAVAGGADRSVLEALRTACDRVAPATFLRMSIGVSTVGFLLETSAFLTRQAEFERRAVLPGLPFRCKSLNGLGFPWFKRRILDAFRSATRYNDPRSQTAFETAMTPEQIGRQVERLKSPRCDARPSREPHPEG